jgi:GNAT superfamily N-acetyltransferase
MAPLVPLFRRTFGRRDFNLEWLKKKYACEYQGIRGFSCVAFSENGHAVGSFGVLPWPIRFGDRTEVAAQLVDAATDRDHRRRGLFTQLGEMASELSEAAGISFIFAFPHPRGASYPGFIRNLGYEHIDDLVEYRKTICSGLWERASLRAGSLRRLYERQVQPTLNSYAPGDATLQNSLLSEGFAATDRDRTFHAYKSFAGSRVLDLDGGRVWLKVRRGLLVGDLEAVSEADLEKTAKALGLLAARLGTHQIVFQSSKGTRFSRFFEDRFQPLPCLTVVYRNLRSQIPPEALRFTFGDLDNF